MVVVVAVPLLSGTTMKPDGGDVEFYVNSGKTKITSIECYDFDNMMIRFKIKPEMFKYERVLLELKWDAESGESQG